MKKEKWKRLKEEKGYLISSWGRVFSTKTETMMRPYIHKSRANRYLRIGLPSAKFMVHVLVANNFKSKELENLKKLYPNENFQVNHLDRNTLNPNENNLSWETEGQNKSHRHETDVINFGGKTYKAKLEAKVETL